MIFQSWFTSDCLTALRVRYAQIGEFQSVCMGEFGCEFFFYDDVYFLIGFMVQCSEWLDLKFVFIGFS